MECSVSQKIGAGGENRTPLSAPWKGGVPPRAHLRNLVQRPRFKRGVLPLSGCVSHHTAAAYLVPVVGIELTTSRLQGGCSTTELNRLAPRRGLEPRTPALTVLCSTN